MRPTHKIQILVFLTIAAFMVAGCPEKKEVVKPDKMRTVIKVSQPEEFYNQGVDALKANDSDRALASFQEAISRIKEDPQKLVDAHYNIGAILLQKGDLGGARKAFDEALKLQPDHRDALVNLGVVLKRRNDFAGAIAHYREALKKVPRDPLIMNNLIVAYRLNKQYAQAEKTGHRLLARAPNNVEAYKNMTLIYYDQGKYEMAELLCINAGKMLEKQREKDKTVKDDPGIYNNLGMIYMKMGKVREALAQFGKALKVDPNSINALINTGAIAHRYRDYGRAVAAYDQVLKLQPQNPIALKGLAFAYFGAGQADKAIEYFKKVNQADPKDLKILFNLGECYYTYKHNYQEAIKYYRVYKVKMGSALDKSDPVHNRLQMAETKLQMAEQVKKDEEEARRKEEERKKALDRTKQEQAEDKAKGEKTLKDILKTQEGEEPPPAEGQEQKPGEGAPPAAGAEEQPKDKEEGKPAGEPEKVKEPKKGEQAAPKKAEEKAAPKKDQPKEEPSEKKEEKGKAK
jgi:tetratricopeptide (TPR) repeat protein